MKDRIRQLRKELGISQVDFGNKIGVKQGSIAGYETGARIPLDAVINSICREFNVNEEWLRDGVGEMFKKRLPTEEVAEYVEDLLEYDGVGNPFYDMIIEMMKSYKEMDEKSKITIRNYFDSVKKGIEKKKEG